MLIRLTNFQQTFGMEYEHLEDLVSKYLRTVPNESYHF